MNANRPNRCDPSGGRIWEFYENSISKPSDLGLRAEVEKQFQKSIAELVIHIKEHPSDFPGGLPVLVSAFICVHLRLVCYVDQCNVRRLTNSIVPVSFQT
jgi:hypothetical protein